MYSMRNGENKQFDRRKIKIFDENVQKKKMLILIIAIYALHTLIMKDRKIVKSADKRCGVAEKQIRRKGNENERLKKQKGGSAGG